MNGMDNILRRIREDAQREMDAMQQEALEKREAILARGREQSERLLAEGRQKNLQLAEGRKARLISAKNQTTRPYRPWVPGSNCRTMTLPDLEGS